MVDPAVGAEAVSLGVFSGEGAVVEAALSRPLPGGRRWLLS